jgi:glycosyltransferase involved in cell wall biosynthesis
VKKSKIIFDLSVLSNEYLSGIEFYVKNLDKYFSTKKNYLISGLGVTSNQLSASLPTLTYPSYSNTQQLQDDFLSLILEIEQPDLYFSPYSPIPVYNTCKTLITVHDLIPLRHPNWFVSDEVYSFFDNAIRRSCVNADHVIADSFSTKNDIIELFGINSSKITVVHLAASAGFNPRNKTKDSIICPDLKIKKPYILSTCTFEPRKNLLGTIKAFNKLKTRLPAKNKLKLVLVGAMGWKVDNIKSAINSSRFKDDIIVTGYVKISTLYSLYANAEAFIYPSFYEGFGLPILEAMSSGVPVVTSSNSSLVEVGANAVIYKNPYDSGALSEGLELAIYDRNARDNYIQLGYIQSAKFSWEKTTNETLNIFDKILD